MNFRTTGLLLAAVIAFALAYLLLVPKTGNNDLSVKPPSPSGSVAAQPVIEPKMGEVTKITCKVDGAEWAFEKAVEADSKAAAWKMIKPQEIKVQGFDVDRIARQLTGLQYEVSFEPGASGVVTAAQAGLEPPQTVITLTDGEGKSATVEIGNAASTNETYVRIPGSSKILVGSTALRNMLKPRAIEYRDPQLWNISADKVTKVDIVDRSDAASPVEYRFVRDGGRWNMESPVAARATNKVDELLQTVSRLRVTKWEDDRPERVVAYGLQPPALSLQVTVEEDVAVNEKTDQVKTADAATAEAPETPKTVKKQTVHELHVSSLSPVGEDTKTYVRVGAEHAVASIMKTTTEKLRPVMNDWRDMHVSQANASNASQFTYSTPSGAATLVRKEDGWHFDTAEDSPARADDAAVAALLQQAQGLNATAYVNESIEILAAANFNRPVADLKLTAPGEDGTERIVIGGYCDPQTKRLHYARRNDSKSIAKVKADDAALLIAGPRALRDRTILSLPGDAISQLAFMLRNSCTETPLEFTVARGAGGWAQVAPVGRGVRAEPIEALITSLKSLSALALAADEAELTAFGLDQPAVKLIVTYGDPAVPLSLIATAHDGKYYAQRLDRPVIYEIAAEVYQLLAAELRPAEVLRVDVAKVKTFTIREDDTTHGFERSGSKWTYAAERDLPLDPKKVENLLLQINDLKTERVVSFAPEDLDAFGLSAPMHEVVLEMDGGSKKVIRISAEKCDSNGISGFYSRITDSPEVFLIAPDMVNRMKVSLPSLE